MEQQIADYLDHIRGDFCGWLTGDTESRAKMRDDFINGTTYEVGSKYIKVITDRRVHSFIVRRDGGKFKAGDILKAASWRAPATNFARGNILTGNYKTIRWTGC